MINEVLIPVQYMKALLPMAVTAVPNVTDVMSTQPSYRLSGTTVSLTKIAPEGQRAAGARVGEEVGAKLSGTQLLTTAPVVMVMLTLIPILILILMLIIVVPTVKLAIILVMIIIVVRTVKILMGTITELEIGMMKL